MKSLLRSFLFNLAGIYLASRIFSTGFVINGGMEIYAVAAVVLTLVNLLLRPIVSLITAPLNFLSFGLLGFVVNGLMLYAAAYFIPQIQFHVWNFPGLTYQGYIIPAMQLPSLGVIIITAFVISLIVDSLGWLSR